MAYAVFDGNQVCVGLSDVGSVVATASDVGKRWNGSAFVAPFYPIADFGDFTPSIYSAAKSATTTVVGQSEAIATGAKKLEAVNDDSTNNVIIGLGNSAALAEAACSSGASGVDKFLILPKARMHKTLNGYSHYAWLGVGGTVSVRITQGV